jgi:hypothetical protein
MYDMKTNRILYKKQEFPNRWLNDTLILLNYNVQSDVAHTHTDVSLALCYLWRWVQGIRLWTEVGDQATARDNQVWLSLQPDEWGQVGNTTGLCRPGCLRWGLEDQVASHGQPVPGQWNGQSSMGQVCFQTGNEF